LAWDKIAEFIILLLYNCINIIVSFSFMQ